MVWIYRFLSTVIVCQTWNTQNHGGNLWIWKNNFMVNWVIISRQEISWSKLIRKAQRMFFCNFANGIHWCLSIYYTVAFWETEGWFHEKKKCTSKIKKKSPLETKLLPTYELCLMGSEGFQRCPNLKSKNSSIN